MSTHATNNGKHQKITRTHFDAGQRLTGQEDDALAPLLLRQYAQHRGVVPSARIAFGSTNPSNV